MAVPEVLATRDGRSRVDGLVLFSWLEGWVAEPAFPSLYAMSAWE